MAIMFEAVSHLIVVYNVVDMATIKESHMNKLVNASIKSFEMRIFSGLNVSAIGHGVDHIFCGGLREVIFDVCGNLREGLRDVS